MSFRTATQRGRTLRRVALAVTAVAVTAAAAVTFPMIASAESADVTESATAELATAPAEHVPSDDGHDDKKRDPKDDPKDHDPKDPKDPKDPEPEDPKDPKDPGFEFPPFDEAAIVPGVELATQLTDGTALCTANFVHEVDGELFLGSAAHCHAEGESTNLDGCDPANVPVPLGTAVIVAGLDGQQYVTELAYSSWETMQAIGEDDEDTCFYNDYALLRIDPADYDVVNPSVPEFGGPEGVKTDGFTFGDRVFSYQNDSEPVGIPVMRAKQGIYIQDADDEGLGYIVQTMTPGFQGDSGSGYLDEHGQAFGVLSYIFQLETGEILNGVTDLAKAQNYAEVNADAPTITVVDGTEPFEATGVPMDALPASPLSAEELQSDSLLGGGLESLLGELSLLR